MAKRRQLVVERLEPRVVLNGIGLGQGAADPEWARVIVTLHEQTGSPQAVAEEVLGRLGGQVGHVYEHALKGFSAQLPAAAVAALANNPRVKTLEFDQVLQTAAQTVPTGVARIATPSNPHAGIGTGRSVDVDIAIIDSGIQPNHPDLNVAGGVRFYTVTGGPPKSRGSFTDGEYQDDNGHGTHVAGIAAAMDNGFGVVGVAPGSRLWAVRVLDATGNGYMSDIIAGVNWVVARAGEIEVANMSLRGFGVSPSPGLREAIQNGVAAGIVFVAASGNDYRDILGADRTFGTSDDIIPAAYPEVATISAIADSDGMPGGLGPITSQGYADDTFADFSNYSNSDGAGLSWYDTNNVVTSPGLGIDLMLPGVDILSTYKGNSYATISGTSMAAPHAAGLAALYIAQHGRADDATGVYEIRQALIDAGKPWRSDDGLQAPPPGASNPDSPDKHEENLGWAGKDNPAPALTVAFTRPTAGAVLDGTVSLLVAASYSGGGQIRGVEFFVGEEWLGEGQSGDDGWSFEWATTGVDDGQYTLRAVVVAQADSGEPLMAEASITVTVDNIPALPTVEIVAPAGGAQVSGEVTLTAVASADSRSAVEQVAFSIQREPDGQPAPVGIDSDGSDGWSVIWDSALVEDGSYWITAEITDDLAQTAAHTIPVTVDNSVGSMDANLDGTAVWVNKAVWEARVTVSVVDSLNRPLTGATVTGFWNGGSSLTGITNAQGQITFTSDRLKVSSTTFTLTSVSLEGYVYQGSYPSITVHSNGSTSGNSATAYEAAALWDLLEAEAHRKGKRHAAGDDPAAAAVDQLMGLW